jgi:hypothetical protein
MQKAVTPADNLATLVSQMNEMNRNIKQIRLAADIWLLLVLLPVILAVGGCILTVAMWFLGR